MVQTTLLPVDRLARIQQMIEKNGVVKVSDLSREFGVTELTIRRDFDRLEEKGLLERMIQRPKWPMICVSCGSAW